MSAEPDRSRLRETFRTFELREPLRRLEEALGSADAGKASVPLNGEPAGAPPPGDCAKNKFAKRSISRGSTEDSSP